jgi:hypothetical protein
VVGRVDEKGQLTGIRIGSLAPHLLILFSILPYLISYVIYTINADVKLNDVMLMLN